MRVRWYHLAGLGVKNSIPSLSNLAEWDNSTDLAVDDYLLFHSGYPGARNSFQLNCRRRLGSTDTVSLPVISASDRGHG